jgi:WD40 repeat protein
MALPAMLLLQWSIAFGSCGRCSGLPADGTSLLSGGDDKALEPWEVAAGQLIRTYKGHTKAVSWVAFRSMACACSPAATTPPSSRWDAGRFTAPAVRALVAEVA